MDTASPDVPPLWLWRGVVGGLTILLMGGALLFVALKAGWNDPRPVTPADWRASASFTLEVADGAVCRMTLLDVDVDRFAIEALVTPLEGSDFNAYGLAFSVHDPTRYAVFAAGSDGYLVVLSVDGDEETPLFDWQAFPHIRRGGESNRLRVACGDGVCRFWANDEHVTTLTDDFAGKGLGLWVRRFDPGPLRVRFDRVAVWRDAFPARSVVSCLELCFEYNQKVSVRVSRDHLVP